MEETTVTLKQILEEGKKQKRLKVSENQFIAYTSLTEKESKMLKAKARETVKLERQKRKLLNPTPTLDEKEISEKELGDMEREVLASLTFWKGFNKADPTITQDMVEEMPSEMKLGLELQLLSQQFDGMDEERLGKLKKLLDMSKDFR